MAAKLTKSQKAKKRAKSKKNKIKKMEREDSLGISRKQIYYTLSPKVFVILKIISIILIPVIYFVYSPLLLVAVLFSILMFVFAIMTERKINHTFIKANHIKIPKFDSIIGILVLIITFFSMLMSFNTKRKMPSDNAWMEFKMTLTNVGSCYTGRRGKNMGRGFAAKEPPEGMPSMMERLERKEMDMSDLPVEALFSVVVSSVNTVFIFLIPVSSSITLILYYMKKKKFDKIMNEKIDNSIPEIPDSEFERIFLFGYIETPSSMEEKDLDEATGKI
jgi:hypothetical protein